MAAEGHRDASGGGAISVSDGGTTVDPCTAIEFTSGATVTDAGSGVAEVAISGGGGGSLDDPIESTPNGAPVAITTTPASVVSISIPAPSGTSDTYLVWFRVQDDISGVTATGGTRSSGYYLDDGSPILASAVAGFQVPTLAAAVVGVNAMMVGNITPYLYTATGAVTLTLYGVLNSSVTGTWNAGINSGMISALKIYSTP